MKTSESPDSAKWEWNRTPAAAQELVGAGAIEVDRRILDTIAANV